MQALGSREIVRSAASCSASSVFGLYCHPFGLYCHPDLARADQRQDVHQHECILHHEATSPSSARHDWRDSPSEFDQRSMVRLVPSRTRSQRSDTC